MKAVATGFFIAFLLFIHGIIMVIAVYKIAEKPSEIKFYPTFLFIFSFLGVINDLIFAIGICSPSKLIYNCIEDYVSICSNLYLLLHVIGIVSLSYLIHIEEDYKEVIGLYVYIIYIVASGVIFYTTYKLLRSIINDSKNPKKPSKMGHID